MNQELNKFKYYFKYKILIAYYYSHYIGLQTIFKLNPSSKNTDAKNKSYVRFLSWLYTDKKLQDIASTLLDNLVKPSFRLETYTSEKDPQKEIIDLSNNIIKQFKPLLNIIGIQPMTGPVGLTYLLKVSKKENSMSVFVEKQTVEAATRAFTTKYSDTNTGFNKKDTEIFSVIEEELATELMLDVINVIKQNAGVVDSQISINESTRYGDYGNAICREILATRSLIARETRRGAGNFAIINSTIVTYLQQSQLFEAATQEEINSESNSVLSYAGRIGVIKVYINPHSNENNEIIVGYKGANEVDSGLVINPYMLLLKDVVLEQGSYEPVAKFKYRGGITKNTGDTIGPNNYYKRLILKILTGEENDSK